MFSNKFWLKYIKKTAPHWFNFFFHITIYGIHLMADLCIFYYNSGSGKITNIKPGFSMDRFTWRPVKASKLNSGQNIAPV